MVISYTIPVCLLAFLQFIMFDTSSATADSSFSSFTEDSLQAAIKRVSDLHKTRQGLTSLKAVIEEMDHELSENGNQDSEGCIWNGIYYPDCTMLRQKTSKPKEGNDKTMLNNWPYKSSPEYEALQDSYKSGALVDQEDDPYINNSPLSGKRILSAFRPIKKRTSSFTSGASDLADIARKRRVLTILQRLLDEMDKDVVVEQKRMCRFNLGGHCATESAAEVANQWHYLNSPLSPGRKRREAAHPFTQFIKNTMKGAVQFNEDH